MRLLLLFMAVLLTFIAIGFLIFAVFFANDWILTFGSIVIAGDIIVMFFPTKVTQSAIKPSRKIQESFDWSIEGF